MNNDNPHQKSSSEEIYEFAFVELSKRLPFTSVGEVLSDLQLVVERISFSSIATNTKNQDAEYLKTKVSQLLDVDVPKQVIAFCNLLIDKKILILLDGERGRYFISHCSKRLKSIPQVDIFVPCKIHLATKHSLAEKIQKMYSHEVRVVFNTSPSVVAGFVIRDGSKTIDLSLGSASNVLISKHITKKLKEISGGQYG